MQKEFGGGGGGGVFSPLALFSFCSFILLQREEKRLSSFLLLTPGFDMCVLKNDNLKHLREKVSWSRDDSGGTRVSVLRRDVTAAAEGVVTCRQGL